MTRAGALFSVAISAWMFVLLSGCAAPGEPTSRHPVVPVAITDLAARQSGSDTVLSFSVPTRSADRVAFAETPTVEIYRLALPAGATPDRKSPWRLVYTIPSERVDAYLKLGHVEFRDPLTPDELSHPTGNSLAYMVRTRVAKARASDNSNFVVVRIYPSPAAPRDVHTTVTESAIDVAWTDAAPPSEATSGGYRVYRAEIESEPGSRPQDVSQSKLKSALVLLGPSSTGQFKDSHFEFGKTYLYTVRTVAQFGGESVESADSTPAVVTPRDVFPPAAPSGLETAVIPVTPQTPAYVELSWAIGAEGDLAGYYVYRSNREDTSGERLNVELLPSPTFRDASVAPGGHYFYRVSAVDRSGNETPKSSAVQVEVP